MLDIFSFLYCLILSMFVHLHGHSTYSMLESLGSIKQIIAKVSSLGMSSVALTDYFGLYGIVDFYRTATDNDIKPIFGIELQYVSRLSGYISDGTEGNIVLLADSLVGYTNLLALVSFATEHLVNEKPTVDDDILQQYKDGLFCLVGGVLSCYGKKLTHGSSQEILHTLLNNFLQIFGKDRFVVEVVAQDYSLESDYKNINDSLIKFADNNEVLSVVTSNFHYVNNDDKQAYELALAIKDGYKIYDEERRKVVGNYHIYSEEEIRSTLAANGFSQEKIDSLINNTQLIADQCEIKLDLYQSLFPKYENPEKIIGLYDDHKNELVEKIG